MKIIRSLRALQKKFKNPVVTIGVYDALHKGHTRILEETVKTAKRIGGHSIAITFDPHPQGECTLYNLNQRLEMLASFGLDACVVLRFNDSLSNKSAEDFVREIIAGRLHACYIFVGEDFRFGKNASGDIKLLKRLSRSRGFQVRILKVRTSGGKIISSTLIRKLIRNGKVRQANRLLARPYFTQGVVVSGNAFGRRLGFPTANIRPVQKVSLPEGVYAARITVGTASYNGLCYIGDRPTITRQEKNEKTGKKSKRRIEAYIFEFSSDIYAKNIVVEFLSFLRPQKFFASSHALAKQIKKDTIAARSVFSPINLTTISSP